ncbi:glycoside hydrolase family 31 protein [Abyssalbus ytuae]|uniref:DUF4968 domain-containing protein n=1 Tax=Abyssalbus ytuae TaxID=2926907 RepID=A0A9E7CTV6_9FLAO|nr:TIM-barrel domain-containing protein [Abyssalbus ytuae]UOB18791.1 DUF4968 domain-containing protein [Abyssalbus ytuae]
MNKLYVIFFLITSFVCAQNVNRTFISHSLKDNHLEIMVSDGKYIIKPYSKKIIETSFVPDGEQFRKESHAVVLEPVEIRTTFKNSENTIAYSTTGISVSITKNPFQISYYYNSKPVISEKAGYVKTDSTEIIEFNVNDSEILYGGGERVLGMNRRGHRLELYNKAHYGYTTHAELMNFTIPLVMSSRLYAVHFDNPSIGYLDLDSKSNNTLSYETIGGRKTYQVIVGDSWSGLLDNYTDLTGKQPMPPRWMLGNFSSRFGYHSEAETRKTIHKFLEEKIPLDAVILDLYWFGKEVTGTMGNLEFDRDSFPAPYKMIKDFKEKGVKTVLITEPFILTTSKRWEEAVNQKILATDSVGNPFTYDFFFGHTGLIDIFKKEGKDWFWNIYKNLTRAGVAGWWGDLGEPEVHPGALRHITGTANELHNIYGHTWAQLIYEGYKKYFPKQRPFILMRSGYSGSQRYGLIPWSGDVSRSWGGLQSQVEIALQMGMQGIAYMHSDLGGFAGDLNDPELYTRWLQYGVFQPVFRPHAQEAVASEPVYKDEKTKKLAKKSIELRYKLLPYNYTLVFENNQHGIPLMRPLFFEESNNPEFLNTTNAYLWGNDFLISPVVEKEKKEQTVTFPSTGNWIDFYADKIYTAGSTQNILLEEDHIPVFVRSGAFIPMVRVIQSTDEYSLSDIDLHFYFDKSLTESSGKLYNDDGITPQSYEKESFEILYFKSKLEEKYLTISVNAATGKNYKAEDKKINLILHNTDFLPKHVKINGKKVEYQYKKLKNTLEIPFRISGNSSKSIKIKIK